MGILELTPQKLLIAYIFPYFDFLSSASDLICISYVFLCQVTTQWAEEPF